MIQAVLSNPSHPEYGVATIPFPIPRDQYAHCMELLAALEMPASRMLQGVLKSGSPTPRLMQWGISAARSKNFRIPEGRMALAAGASSSS